MAADPDVLAYLRRELARDPSNTAMRLQLAGALLDDDPRASLTEVGVVLATAPGDELALRLGIQAARRTGDAHIEAAYRQLLPDHDGDLAPIEERPAPDAARPDPADRIAVTADVQASEDESADVFDEFLREVLAEDAKDRVTLDDVGGLDEVKQRLQSSFLGPMRSPKLRAAFGTSLRGGLLLYGPPGCGKTFLARAVAGELGARFLAVGLHDVLDMWLGNSEKNLHGIFEEARRLAPCVLFLDEVDALGQKRSHLTHSAGRNVVVQLLTELDSLVDDNDGLFVLGATNAPWDMDPALRRPGRFDRTLLVLPPDEPARLAILAYHLADKPVADDVSLAPIAAATARFSGADLRLLTSAAAEAALAESVDAGTVRPITDAHLRAALSSSKPTTGAWFEHARNFAVFANGDGEYDDLLAWMRANGMR